MPELKIALVGADVRGISLDGTPTPWERGASFSIPSIDGGLVVESVAERPGMTVKEVVLTVAISFGTGVPASLVANWIWARMEEGGEVTVVVEEEDGLHEPSTPEELELHILKAADRHRELRSEGGGE